MSVNAAAPAPSPAVFAHPRTRLREFDAISEVNDIAVAWTLRDLSTGEQETFVAPRKRGDAVLPVLVKSVADWVTARSGGDKVSLRCFSIALRDALSEQLDRDLFLPGDLIQMNSARAWAQQARADLRRQLDETQRACSQADRGVLYAASDGSAHPLYGNAAYAWVTHTGQWFSARTRGGILTAEVRGILSFAETFVSSGYAHGVVFVDSLEAINAIRSESRLTRMHVPFETLALTRRMLTRNRLELVWVRSHQGHVLNDLADRVALLRHRSARLQLTDAQVAAVAANIVSASADTLAATDWAAETALSRALHMKHVHRHVA